MFTRTRYQYGSLDRKHRETGEEAWEFRYYETDSKGQRQRRAATVGTIVEYPTESAARKSPVVQAILLQINAERPQNAVVVPEFGAILARYEREEMPERASTKASYQSYIRNHIRPRWAEVPVNRITPMPVEDWLKRLQLAPKTRSHIRSLMHTIFQCAERWELVGKNPIKLVRVKGGSKRLKTPRVLTPDEFQQLLKFIREPFRTMVQVAGCLGLRVSEIVGLKWSDFDLGELTLLVQRSRVHGKDGDVKTEYSRDRVPLDPALVQVLVQHRSRWLEAPDGWVFANPVTRRPYYQEEIQKRHIRKAGIAAAIGGDIGWHTFRHSYRSWLDEAGAPMTVQKELMRHASIQTTMNVYGKAMSDTKRQAHSKVVAMVLKKPEPLPETGTEGSKAVIGS